MTYSRFTEENFFPEQAARGRKIAAALRASLEEFQRLRGVPAEPAAVTTRARAPLGGGEIVGAGLRSRPGALNSLRNGSFRVSALLDENDAAGRVRLAAPSLADLDAPALVALLEQGLAAAAALPEAEAAKLDALVRKVIADHRAELDAFERALGRDLTLADLPPNILRALIEALDGRLPTIRPVKTERLVGERAPCPVPLREYGGGRYVTRNSSDWSVRPGLGMFYPTFNTETCELVIRVPIRITDWPRELRQLPEGSRRIFQYYYEQLLKDTIERHWSSSGTDIFLYPEDPCCPCASSGVKVVIDIDIGTHEDLGRPEVWELDITGGTVEEHNRAAARTNGTSRTVIPEEERAVSVSKRRHRGNLNLFDVIPDGTPMGDTTIDRDGTDYPTVAVHEFGHMIGLADEYDNRNHWGQEGAPDQSPHLDDTESVMHSGRKFQLRHYLPFEMAMQAILAETELAECRYRPLFRI